MNWILFLVLAADDNATKAQEILRGNCIQCHSPKMAMSGLDLDTREAALKGGTRGPALIAGKANESKLIEAVERKGKLLMPPNKPLNASEIEVLRSWIDEGANWDTTVAAKAPQPTWWAFQKVSRPEPPKVDNARNEVDAFVLDRLAKEKLPAAHRASAATLARRAYMDLLGLPATAEQIKAFVDDKSPSAWSNLIDKLLASPHYGEKWGRHWLDLVRYADTAGFELDTYIHDAWRYRDWVINAFNDDNPCDRVIREQIAADELMPEDPVALTGTGL